MLAIRISLLLCTFVCFVDSNSQFQCRRFCTDIYKFDGLDNGIIRRNGAMYQKKSGVHDDRLGAPSARNVMRFNGRGARVDVPAIQIRTSSFEISVWVKLESFNRVHSIYGDWSNQWQFRLYISKSNKVNVDLRRDLWTAGSDPRQDLLSVAGGNVTTKGKQWQLIKVKWDRRHLTIFLNDEKVAHGKTSKKENLRKNNHSTYEVGYKKDTMNDYFHGYMANLMVETCNM